MYKFMTSYSYISYKSSKSQTSLFTGPLGYAYTLIILNQSAHTVRLGRIGFVMYRFLLSRASVLSRAEMVCVCCI